MAGSILVSFCVHCSGIFCTLLGMRPSCACFSLLLPTKLSQEQHHVLLCYLHPALSWKWTILIGRQTMGPIL